VESRLRADRDVPGGMVFMRFCYAEAAANLLTDSALDPFGKIPKFRFCAARAGGIPPERRSRRSRKLPGRERPNHVVSQREQLLESGHSARHLETKGLSAYAAIRPRL
jgi:hypothetical protein